MNLSGPRTELTTSPGMMLRLRKSKKYALVARWCSEQSPKARTRFTMFSDKPMRVDILFAVVIRFPDGKGYTVTARPMTDKEERQYRRWKER
jgi:hypothetical protein